MQKGYTYEVAFQWSSGFRGDAIGYANIRIFKDENIPLGETTTQFTFGEDSPSKIQYDIERAAEAFVDDFLKDKNAEDKLALLTFASRPQKDVDLKPLLAAIDTTQALVERNSYSVLSSLDKIQNKPE